MSVSSSKGNGYHQDQIRRASDDAVGGPNDIGSQLINLKPNTSSRGSSQSVNNDRLLNHIECRASAGNSVGTGELLNYLETNNSRAAKNSNSISRSAPSSVCSASRASHRTHMHMTSSSSMQQVTTTNNSNNNGTPSKKGRTTLMDIIPKIGSTSSRVRRLLLEQDASANASVSGFNSVRTIPRSNTSQNNLMRGLMQESESIAGTLSIHTQHTNISNEGSENSNFSFASWASICEWASTISLSGGNSVTNDANNKSRRDNRRNNRNNNGSGASSHQSVTSEHSTAISLIDVESCLHAKQQLKWSHVFVICASMLFVTSLYKNMFANQYLEEYSVIDLSAQSRAAAMKARGGKMRKFRMCHRITPFTYAFAPISTEEGTEEDAHGNSIPPNNFNPNWPKQLQSNKILLLRNDNSKFGRIGNQYNSILHAFDYARDYNLHLGMLYHSWAMDVIHTMFYESNGMNSIQLDYNLLNDLGIVIIRNQTQLELYEEVITLDAQELYFYKSPNLQGVASIDDVTTTDAREAETKTVPAQQQQQEEEENTNNNELWKIDMEEHKLILQRLYLRYNQGRGYVHTGLVGQDVCSALNMFFPDRDVSEVKYSVSK